VLWIVSLGVHLGYDYLVEGKNSTGLGTASLLLYLGVTFTIQRLILQARAQLIPGASPQKTGAPTASWLTNWSQPPSKLAPAGDGRESAGPRTPRTRMLLRSVNLSV